jgi:arylsulfatase A-like enzyme
MTHEPLPDIIVLTLDALRRDSLSVYAPSLGTTPFLAGLAQECVVFDDAISASCWTLPSHCSLFTGLYPSFHGATKRHWLLAKDRPTLAQVLSRAGYQTAGFTGGPYLHWAFGVDRGFEHYANCLERRPGRFGLVPRSFLRRLGRRRGPIEDELLQRAVTKVTAKDLNAEFAAWLDRGYDDRRPLFAFINYFDSHRPWLARDNEFTPRHCKDYEEYGSRLTQVLREEVPLDPEATDDLVQLYRNEILYLDNHLSELFRLLKDRGLYNDSVIIILSDHGEMLGEHNMWDHIMLYEPAVRIPMLMKLPNSHLGGKRIPQLVQNVDVMPTLLSIIGIASPGEIQGESLAGLINDDIPLKRPYALSEFYPDERTAQTYGPRFQGDFIAYVERPWKYVYSSTRTHELYHCENDPFEEHNLIDSCLVPERVRADLLAKLRSSVNPRLIAGVSKVDADVLSRLRGLGYV